MNTFLKSFFFNILTIFTIISFSFLLIYFIPGDPVDFILKDSGSLEDKIRLRTALGLDKSFFEQYLVFLKKLSVLNMGRSLLTGESVFEMLLEQSAFTFVLAAFALVLSFVWGILFGVFSLKWKPSFFGFSRFFNRIMPGISEKLEPVSLRAASGFFDMFPVLLFSVPAFVLAPLLTAFFSLYLKWLPVSGAGSLAHLILPSVSLAVPLGAVLMKSPAPLCRKPVIWIL